MRDPDPSLSHPLRPGAVLAVVGIGTLLVAMAASMVNLALPSLGRDLGISIETSRWVVQAFLLTTTLALLPGGRLSDRFGHERIYLAGFTLFGLASLVCGAAGVFWLLVAGRVLQGLGGALLMASSPALLTTAFPAQKRGRALGLLATATYTGLMIGPPLAGAVVEWLSWRYTFFLMVPITGLMLVLGLCYLPWTQARSAGPVSLGLDLFRSPVFAGAFGAALCNYTALFGMVLLVPFYLEEGLGLSSARAGLVLTAQPLLMAAVASPSGWLSDRNGTRSLGIAGMLVLGAGLAGLSSLGPASTPETTALWLALCGLGTGLFISPNSSALMGAAPRERQGAAGSLLALGRNLGMLLGVALATTLFKLQGARTGAAWGRTEHDSLSLVLQVSAGVALLGALLAALRPRLSEAPRP